MQVTDDDGARFCRRSTIHTVIDEEGNSTQVFMFSEDNRNYRGQRHRSIIRTDMHSIGLDDILPDHESPVAAIHAITPFRLRYNLNYNAVIVQNALNVEHMMGEPDGDRDTDISRRARSQRVTVQRAPVRRRRNVRVKSGLPSLRKDEDDMLEEAILESMAHMKKLRATPGTTGRRTTLRFDHSHIGLRSVATVLCGIKEDSGDCWKCVTLFWQTSVRPKKAVCITLRSFGRNGEVQGVCSCECLRVTACSTDATCTHLRLALSQHIFMFEVMLTIQGERELCGTDDPCVKYFGNMVDSSIAESVCPVIELTRSNAKSSARNTNTSHVSILPPLPTLHNARAPLATKEKATWYFCATFDTIDKMFVPFMWERRRGYLCLMCRKSNSGVGCAHEAAARSAGLIIRRIEEEGESNLPLAEEDGYAPGDDNDCSNLPPDEVILDLRDEQSSSDEGEPDSELERFEMQSTVPEALPVAPSVLDTFGYGEYCSNIRKRAPVLCPGEVEETRNLIDRILSLETGNKLTLEDVGIVECRAEGCEEIRKSDSRTEKIFAKLYMVAHPPIEVNIIEWFCEKCREVVKYTGEKDAIFPATCTYLYTTELMYLWVWDVCLKGRSFWDTYETACQSSCAISTMHRCEILHNIRYEWKVLRTGRRIANSALRTFIKRIDISNDHVTSVLFTCNSCERPLTQRERKEFQIAEDDDVRRFKALVVDGTAAGILGNLPKFSRPTFLLTCKDEARVNPRLISSSSHVKAIRNMLSRIRASIRFEMKKKNRRASTAKVELVPERATTTGFTDLHVRILRMMLGEGRCICANGRNGHSEQCSDLRNSTDHDDCIQDVLRSVFRIELAHHSPSGSIGSEQVEEEVPSTNRRVTRSQSRSRGLSVERISRTHGRTGSLRGLSTSVRQADVRNEPTSRDGQQGRTNRGIPRTRRRIVHNRVTMHGGISRTEQSAVDEGSIFQRTRGNSRGRRGRGGSRSRGSAGNGRGQGNNGSGRGRREETSSERYWTVSSKLGLTEHTASFLESILLVIRLLICENSGLMYMLTSSAAKLETTSEGPGLQVQDMFESQGPEEEKNASTGEALNGDLMRHSTAFNANVISHTLTIHADLAHAFTLFAECQHISIEPNVEHSLQPCANCSKTFSDMLFKVRNVNPILCRFGREVLRVGRLTGSFARSITGAIADLLRLHVDHARDYLKIVSDNVSMDSAYYRRKYSGCNISPLPTADMDDQVTGSSFPGRKQYRPFITFDKKDTSFATKSILTRVPILQDYLLSNAAGWFLEKCVVQIDRFHCENHTCLEVFNPSLYPSMESMKTMGAESINARIKKAKHHMRYLRGDNFVPYLRVRFALLNLKAVFQAKYNRVDTEEEDLPQFYRDEVACVCPKCQEISQSVRSARNTDHRSSDEATQIVVTEEAVEGEGRGDEEGTQFDGGEGVVEGGGRGDEGAGRVATFGMCEWNGEGVQGALMEMVPECSHDVIMEGGDLVVQSSMDSRQRGEGDELDMQADGTQRKRKKRRVSFLGDTTEGSTMQSVAERDGETRGGSHLSNTVFGVNDTDEERSSRFRSIAGTGRLSILRR